RFVNQLVAHSVSRSSRTAPSADQSGSPGFCQCLLRVGLGGRDLNTQNGVAELDFIAFVQTECRQVAQTRVRRRLPSLTTADQPTVDVGAVPAAEVPHTDLRCVDVEHAVAA